MKKVIAVVVLNLLTVAALAEETKTQIQKTEDRTTASSQGYSKEYLDNVNTERQLEDAKQAQKAKFHEKIMDKVSRK